MKYLLYSPYPLSWIVCLMRGESESHDHNGSEECCGKAKTTLTRPSKASLCKSSSPGPGSYLLITRSRTAPSAEGGWFLGHFSFRSQVPTIRAIQRPIPVSLPFLNPRNGNTKKADAPTIKPP